MEKAHTNPKRILIIIIAGTAIIASIAVLWQKIPYQNILTGQIKKSLEARGVTVTSIKLESASVHESALSQVQLGDTNPLKIEHLRLQHSPQGLLQGHVKEIAADGVEANIYKENGVWKIGGIEPLMQAGNSAGNTALFDPHSLPKAVTVNNGSINIADENWSLATAFKLAFENEPEASLNVESTGISFDMKPYKVTSGAANIAAKLNEAEKKWQGDVVINDVNITGLQQELPPLQVNSHLSLTPEEFLGNFIFKDDANTYQADLSLTLPQKNPETGVLNIKSVQIPWGGGVIATKDVQIPVALDKPLPIAIELREVELSSLLGAISGGKIDGTGKISGILPLIYHPDGHITLQEGTAEALEAGLIIVPASLLPGNNPALEIARAALENFHYTSLKIGVYSEGEEQSVIQLTLQGRNPDALDGRPVNLNVKLTGDVLPLLQQSLIPFNDLKKLLIEKSTQ